MSAPNPNWPRWIKLSVVNHFKTVIADRFVFFVEGSTRRTKDEHNYCEIRIDGPFLNEVSKGYWCVDITIDILVDSNKDSVDLVIHERNVGIILAGFNVPISIMKYGNGEDDFPDILLGCLVPTPPPGGDIITTNFGQVEADTRIMQSTVEQTYHMNLRTRGNNGTD